MRKLGEIPLKVGAKRWVGEYLQQKYEFVVIKKYKRSKMIYHDATG